MIHIARFMETQVMGQTLLSNHRMARIVALGDRKNPAVLTPCMIVGNEDALMIPEQMAPFIYEQDNSELPGSLRIHSRLPLAIPFEGNGPDWSIRLPHVLPPSMQEADYKQDSNDGPILVVTWQKLCHDPKLVDPELKPQIVVLLDARQLAEHPGRLASALLILRSRFSSSLIWCPAISGPDNLALLTWMVVDVHDMARTIQCEANDFLLTSSGPRHPESSLSEEVSRDAHVRIWREELANVKQAIREGRLRELVEQRVLSSPRMVEHLRYHDAMAYEEKAHSTLSVVVPTGQALRAHSASSLNDPEVLDWVNFMRRNYLPPESRKEVLVLLPCSQRKPYRNSRSHHRFREAIGNTSAHEVMVTSPLGLVPRDVEMIWPAAHYDVPTTGEWTEDEKVRINDVLSSLIERCDYRLIVNHSGLQFDFLSGIEVINTRASDSATSKEALERLRDAMSQACEKYDIGRQSNSQRLLEEFRSVARRQMRNDSWMNGLEVVGKPPQWKLAKSGVQMAQWLPERGSLSLTKAALPLLFENNSLPTIELISGISWKGDVFSSNLLRFDSDIKKGGDVLVLQDGELRGMARASIASWAWPDSPGRLARGHHRL